MSNMSGLMVTPDIICPANHPYILFVRDEVFFLARSRQHARVKNPKGCLIETVSMGTLFDLVDGNQTRLHCFLKKIGDDWCQRSGMIFYKKDFSNNDRYSDESKV